MRVLYVNQTSQLGGAEVSLLTLLRGLGPAVDPIVACPDGDLADAVRGMRVPWHPIVGTGASLRLHPVHTPRGFLDIGRSSLQLRQLVRDLRPDLVHANTTRAALLTLPRRSAPPLVTHVRDQMPDSALSGLVLRIVGRHTDALVANSAYVARQFDGMQLRRPVRVVHNPVDLDRFDPASADGSAVRREFDLGPDALILSVIAQLTPWKAQDDAIRVLASLAERDHEATLVLVGSAKFVGPGTRFDNPAFERHLHSLADRLGVRERVVFAGERADVPDVLAATDLLLLPSWREPFGRIAVEAMAMAVPVVATSVGGPAEIVRSGEDGLLLPPRMPEEWADRLAPLLVDRRLRLQMGASARLRARDFGVAPHVAEIVDVYAGLVD